jgi:hypothetical protein
MSANGFRPVQPGDWVEVIAPTWTEFFILINIRSNDPTFIVTLGQNNGDPTRSTTPNTVKIVRDNNGVYKSINGKYTFKFYPHDYFTQ